MKKLIIPIAALSLIACGAETKEESNQKKEINLPLVTTQEAKIMPFEEKVSFQATVEADKNVLVSPQSSGVIRGIFVKEGQRVAVGSTLASLDSDILNKNIAELEKSLELATYMFEKQQKLKEQGIGVEVQYEQAKNQKESLESKLATLSTQASKSRVFSPINGYVDEIFPNIGEMASPQAPMFRVLNLDKVTIKSEISEAYLTSIDVGSKASVYFPSIDLRMDNLKITRKGRFINPSNRTFDIQIDLNNQSGKILPNLLAELEVIKSFTKDALLVPSRSIMEDNKGNKYLYVYKDGVATKKNVTVDFVQGDLTQIKKGEQIAEGDQIVVRGAEEIVDGEKVAIKK